MSYFRRGRAQSGAFVTNSIRTGTYFGPGGIGRLVRIRNFTVAALSLASWSACGAPGTTVSPEALAGTWIGELTQAGQEGRVVVEFRPDSAAGVATFLSLPPIDAWDIPLGAAEFARDTVRAGPLELVLDSGRSILRGRMPETLIPVHRVPIGLRRGAPPPRPAGPTEIPRVRPVWTFQAGGAVWGGVLAHDGRVYVGSDDGVLSAIDAESGQLLWEHRTGGAIRAAPGPAAGSILVHSDDGLLYRLDARSGTLVWRARLGDPTLERATFGAPGFRYDQLSSSPVRFEGSVYVGTSGGELVALEWESGRERWRFRAGDLVSSTPILHDGLVFFGSFDGRVYAVRAVDGSLRWSYDTGAPIPSSAGIHDGILIIGSRSYDLWGLHAETGRPAWRHYYWFSWVESSPRVWDGVAYIGSSDAQRLNAIDAASGDLLWAFDTGGASWGRPAVSDDAVFIGALGMADYLVDHRGGFYAVRRSDGSPLWKFPMTRGDTTTVWGFASAPAIASGLVIAADVSGTVYAFDTRDLP